MVEFRSQTEKVIPSCFRVLGPPFLQSIAQSFQVCTKTKPNRNFFLIYQSSEWQMAETALFMLSSMHKNDFRDDESKFIHQLLSHIPMIYSKFEKSNEIATASLGCLGIIFSLSSFINSISFFPLSFFFSFSSPFLCLFVLSSAFSGASFLSLFLN